MADNIIRMTFGARPRLHVAAPDARGDASTVSVGPWPTRFPGDEQPVGVDGAPIRSLSDAEIALLTMDPDALNGGFSELSPETARSAAVEAEAAAPYDPADGPRTIVSLAERLLRAARAKPRIDAGDDDPPPAAA